ncbi:MAG: tRNA uridine-5-carboxymethylaminomethyl(34) synthesis GTPase MnmE [Helicobacteraceae bacterium]|jgi:tRNA modification GTPase|nr:tRNA uridine-5-carboxymethylaminomethyl(34) synthesis GTPase MnmE [Helicobacteraceae bacterium]
MKDEKISTLPTIAALATPAGRGAIAIVRISGENATMIARKITRSENLAPRYAHLKTLYGADGAAFDRAIVIYFAAPKSYTGEDIVEFQTHGGEAAARALIAEITRRGAVLAKPGEFSLRAVKNSKMSLAEAEAAAAYASARAEKAAKLLARTLSGDLAKFAAEARSRILRAMAHAEVSIDYAEDLPSDVFGAIKSQIDELLALLDEVLIASKRRRGLVKGYEIAIIGKPNAGKSSLLNALLGEERAIVSEIAGTTRDLVSEEIVIGDAAARIIDTAGLRHSADRLENIGIEYAKKAAAKADITIALFDGSREFEAEDREVLELAMKSPIRVAAINKCDLEVKINLSEFRDINYVKISAKKDIKELLAALKNILDRETGGEEIYLSSDRQISLVESAIKNLTIASDLLSQNSPELFSYSCNEAIKNIGDLTTPIAYDELLDSMFSEFCLGK